MTAFSLSFLPPAAGLRALLFLGLSAAASPAFAQREVRHLNAVSLSAGRTSTGTYYQGTYGRFLSDRIRFEASASIENGPRSGSRSGEGDPAFRGYELGLGVAPRLLRLGELFYLRLPFQVRTRYERLPPTGPARTDGFAVGPSLGLAGEVYLHDRVSVSVEGRQTWFVLGKPQNTLPRFVGAGLTFYLGQ